MPPLPAGVEEALKAQPVNLLPVPETTYLALQPSINVDESGLPRLIMLIPDAHGAPAHLHIFPMNIPSMRKLAAGMAEVCDRLEAALTEAAAGEPASGLLGPDGDPLTP